MSRSLDPFVSLRNGHNYRALHKNYEPAMTFDEIAEAMGLTRQTVWVLYARALEKIRVQLRKNPHLRNSMLGTARFLDNSRGSMPLPDWSTDARGGARR